LLVRVVNTGTQYVVDIATGTHDVAPALLQASRFDGIERFRRESARAVEILAEMGFIR
jgi:hypothetical protein